VIGRSRRWGIMMRRWGIRMRRSRMRRWANEDEELGE